MPHRTPEELREAVQSRVQAGARRYRGAVMRYLVRPPLSLKSKYAAFLMDLVRQSDHVQDVLGRSAERIGAGPLETLLRGWQREERQRMQLALGDLRRLGYPQEDWARSQALTQATFDTHGVPLGTSVFCQEGQSGMAMAARMAERDYRTMVWPKNLWIEQHGEFEAAPLYRFGDVELVVGAKGASYDDGTLQIDFVLPA
mgnify:CR=1 FL=1